MSHPNRCVRCNPRPGAPSATTAIVQAETDNETVFFLLLTGIVVIFVEIVLLIFSNRLRRNTLLLEYSIVITQKSEDCESVVFIGLMGLLFGAYFYLGILIQVLKFNNVVMDCGNLLGASLNPRADSEDVSVFLNTNPLTILVTLFPFAALTTNIMMHMINRLGNPYMEVQLKTMVEKPWLVKSLRDAKWYGVHESALVKAQKEMGMGLLDWLKNMDSEKLEAVIQKLIEEKALTELDFNTPQRASATIVNCCGVV
jgi:hypothetical protein